jgi:hypothetical protein
MPAVVPAQQPAPQRATDTKAQTVYITRTGKKYHRDACRYLRSSRIPVSLKDAKATEHPFLPEVSCAMTEPEVTGGWSANGNLKGYSPVGRHWEVIRGTRIFSGLLVIRPLSVGSDTMPAIAYL